MTDFESRRSMDLVEDALRTYPLAPVPDSLRIRVMSRIRPASSIPRFTFPWLEVAISLMLSILFTVVFSLLLAIPPATALRVENFARMFFLLPASRPVILAAVLSVVLSVICLAVALRLFRKPFAPRMAAHR